MSTPYRRDRASAAPTVRTPWWVPPLAMLLVSIQADKQRNAAWIWGIWHGVACVLLTTPLTIPLPGMGPRLSLILSAVGLFLMVIEIPLAEFGRRRGFVWWGDLWIKVVIFSACACWALWSALYLFFLFLFLLP